jgi:D-alanyl-D-alanine carboxypeptidase
VGFCQDKHLLNEGLKECSKSAIINGLISNLSQKGGDRMRGKVSILTIIFTVALIFLFLLIASRLGEKPSDSTIDGYSSGKRPGTSEEAGEVNYYLNPTPSPSVYKPDIDIRSWEFILANNDNNIGTYTPVCVQIEGFPQYFDERAIDKLEEFLQAARDAGFTPFINSSFRPYSSQKYIFNGKASQIAWDGKYTYEQAVELAKKIIAYPGTSDHQTGLAVDITDRYYRNLKHDLVNQELLDWLTDNCSNYGFITRYPTHKYAITGLDEPWHFRYVGREAAEYIMENNLCLEQFIELYRDKRPVK